MKTEIGLPYKYSKSVKGYTQLEEVLKNWLKEHKVVHGSRKTWKDFHYRKFYYKKAKKKKLKSEQNVLKTRWPVKICQEQIWKAFIW